MISEITIKQKVKNSKASSAGVIKLATKKGMKITSPEDGGVIIAVSDGSVTVAYPDRRIITFDGVANIADKGTRLKLGDKICTADGEIQVSATIAGEAVDPMEEFNLMPTRTGANGDTSSGDVLQSNYLQPMQGITNPTEKDIDDMKKRLEAIGYTNVDNGLPFGIDKISDIIPGQRERRLASEYDVLLSRYNALAPKTLTAEAKQSSDYLTQRATQYKNLTSPQLATYDSQGNLISGDTIDKSITPFSTRILKYNPDGTTLREVIQVQPGNEDFLRAYNEGTTTGVQSIRNPVIQPAQVTPDTSAQAQTQANAQAQASTQAQANTQAAQDLADSFAYQESLRYNGQTPQQYYQQFQQQPSTQFGADARFSVEDAYIKNALGDISTKLTDNELAIARLNVRKQLETEKQINQSVNQEQMQRFNLGQFAAMQNPALRYNDTRNSGQKAYYDLVNQLQVNQNISDADVQRRKELLAAQDIGLQAILGASNNANTREANLLTSAQNTDTQLRSGFVQQQINERARQQALANQIAAEGRQYAQQSQALITPAERIAILEDLIKDVSISEQDRAIYKQMLLTYKQQLVAQ